MAVINHMRDSRDNTVLVAAGRDLNLKAKDTSILQFGVMCGA